MEQPVAPHWAEVWIPGSIGLLLTGLPLLHFVRLVLLGWASCRWPTVEGTITRSDVEVRVLGPRVRLAFARVSYSFERGVETRHSNHVRFGHFIEANESVARCLTARYPVGKSVSVRVSGKWSVLEPGPSKWLFVWIPMLAFLFGGVLYGLITGT